MTKIKTIVFNTPCLLDLQLLQNLELFKSYTDWEMR